MRVIGSSDTKPCRSLTEISVELSFLLFQKVRVGVEGFNVAEVT